MKQLLLIANWKSNKNITEVTSWLTVFADNSLELEAKEVILCPTFPLLSLVKNIINEKGLALKLGSQDISKFDEGPFTGEVSGKVLKDFVKFAIIGHSERREKLKETDRDIEEKVKLAQRYGLTPILCVQNAETPVPEGVQIVAYEPTFAIGTGTADTPENAEEVARKINELHQVRVMYGGSVNPENVHSFTEKEHIQGVLVGTKSLDPVIFSEIIKNA